jgi:hypothetical protein
VEAHRQSDPPGGDAVTPDPVGLAEIAERLDVARATVDALFFYGLKQPMIHRGPRLR